MVVENEISYSINFSQDLLYIILDSYISKKFQAFQQYYDFVDENGVRTRLSADNTFTSVIKTCTDLKKFVYAYGDVLIPFVDRRSVEEVAAFGAASSVLNRIVKCIVYKSEECPEFEVKFEHVYFNKSLIDKFDSLMASKQIMLWNLLQNKNEKIVKESHLGSDEILAAIRLEYEYEENEPIDRRVLDCMCDAIKTIDAISAHQNISPLLPYTTLQNNIIYRKFEDEILLDSIGSTVGAPGNNGENISIYKWAIKLDGIRGRGFCTKNFMMVFMDDMQLFSGDIEDIEIFQLNNVVAFQCELVAQTLYVTDLMHVFKYNYNNRTQYEISMDPYQIAPDDAVKSINHLAKKLNDKEIKLDTMTTKRCVTVKFQQFFDPPIVANGYSTMPTDGYVVLDAQMRYVKYKHVKTVEVEYDCELSQFKNSEGPLLRNKVSISPSITSLEHAAIYEAIVSDDVIEIIKCRPDRLVPN
ncbi:late expression factor-4 [Alphabaculovirus altersperidaniae]|uniref:Late expression factor-4 n=1 Tax=Spodoptera eridania nucleopolyhedrovirus TaxID=2315721 RepID=A0ABX6TQI9_9ABAC|nr:late expression factor-4 [Spodoptera eridania nucleopolyhedrovirus]QNV47884.1 late expression factor-4 [Spodoptera eridania nucleopolyhedrovirus]